MTVAPVKGCNILDNNSRVRTSQYWQLLWYVPSIHWLVPNKKWGPSKDNQLSGDSVIEMPGE